MQRIESSPIWKDFGNSLRVTNNDFVSPCQMEPLRFEEASNLLKIKQIDLYLNH
jgi:hypothetical protein